MAECKYAIYNKIYIFKYCKGIVQCSVCTGYPKQTNICLQIHTEMDKLTTYKWDICMSTVCLCQVKLCDHVPSGSNWSPVVPDSVTHIAVEPTDTVTDIIKSPTKYVHEKKIYEIMLS